MASDETADLAHVDGILPVVDDRLDDLGTVVDEGDRCQHDPGNQQARLALWLCLDCCRERRFFASFKDFGFLYSFTFLIDIYELAPFLLHG